ncbi:MAG: helix-turn-helix transcriptional regulator [Candidatus Thorarchaeota archaeon]
MSVIGVIVNRIKELREQEMTTVSDREKWTQEGLARRLGVTRQTIISIEKGSYNPSLQLAFKLSRAFEMKIEEIFEYRDDTYAN